MQALCRAEDEEDIVAASQAKAEQVAELAEFNENIPLDDGGEQEEMEELSKAEQEIAALVEQVTNTALLLLEAESFIWIITTRDFIFLFTAYSHWTLCHELPGGLIGRCL